MLHITATEMRFFVFLFEFEFPALEVPRSKFKQAAISKYFLAISNYLSLSKFCNNLVNPKYLGTYQNFATI